MSLSQAPRAHRDPAFLAAKLARLHEPHVAPLKDLADRIAAETGLAVPHPSPLSLNPHPKNRDLILRALQRVVEVTR
jgi:hypothetical protein